MTIKPGDLVTIQLKGGVVEWVRVTSVDDGHVYGYNLKKTTHYRVNLQDATEQPVSPRRRLKK